jgi:pyruvate/2-oxoglutarate dehydrogenase complex dihydrolipoamide acyltransferase (E2) component
LQRRSAKPSGHVAKAAPSGLDSATLLNKINSLDWDPTTTMSGPPPAESQGPALNWRFLLAPLLTGLAILLLGGLVLLVFTGTPAVPVANEPVATEAPAAAPDPTVVAALPTAAAEPPAAPSEQAQEEERGAQRDKALSAAEAAAQRRADKKRKALAEQQAREEQERQRKAEDERRLAEQEAAEARARAAAAAAAVPAPKGPSSPKELCSGEGGFFARNACEARACDLPEWRQHAFCVKRWQEEMRKLNSTEYR